MARLFVGRAKGCLLPLQGVARPAVTAVGVTAPALLYVHHIFRLVRRTVLGHLTRPPVHGVLGAPGAFTPVGKWEAGEVGSGGRGGDDMSTGGVASSFSQRTSWGQTAVLWVN